MIKKVAVVICFIGLIVLSIFIYHKTCESKYAYIDIPKVFGSFEMQKEMKKKYVTVETTRKKILDSLSFELQMMSKKLQADPNNKELGYQFEVKKEQYFDRKKRTDEDDAALSNEYDKQILERMSQYIMEYGKANHYDFIYGADGTGVIMYAKENHNISEEVIDYVNKKYNGVE